MRRFLLGMFLLSGFSGLIYESIWTHYLKLILGHAAYAQTLVLAIFMGGMALGSWGASRVTTRVTNPLAAYAGIEGLIGLMALAFQMIFSLVSARLTDTWLPAAPSPTAATALKWGVSSLLIFPQSVLLGATFPLMSAGIIRAFPRREGNTLSGLYFMNSLGAVAGVLASGFWLVDALGLPGTLLVAGTINLALALAVWLASQRIGQPSAPSGGQAGSVPATARALLLTAAITGAASFCYEIGWIRMLSMVLGSSTHSFELMLAAFILGLALGGWWIRRRIDQLKDPRRFLAWVQLAMAGFALLSLPLYNHLFSLMSWALRALSRTEEAYASFMLLSHALALLVMLPATFCAGMTLPLITLILYRQGSGERAIGHVYAANTLGAIIGILMSVHLLMPYANLKGVILAGALLDGVLGIVLLLAATRARTRTAVVPAAGLGLLLVACGLLVQFDPLRMGSGVYRSGSSSLPASAEVLFWKDGKTASISVIKSGSTAYLSTNGKPDAALNLDPDAQPTTDEVTMTLAGTLPMLYKPDARLIANIGLGSGMTTHTLLAFPGVERVDSIEIEQGIVDAGRLHLGAKVARAFNDPRSHIHIEDAKTYFSSHRERYDVIVSEPSNPWVSGVASLFTDEFYAHVTHYLTPDGLFVQWMQVYETGMPVISSIIKALHPHFEDYAIYTTDNANLLIVARPKGALGPLHPEVLTGAISAELAPLGIRGIEDIRARQIGTKAVLGALLTAQPSPVNSDYFPYVDQHAAQHRFIGSQGLEVAALAWEPVPALEMLGDIPAPVPAAAFGADNSNAGLIRRRMAANLAEVILGRAATEADEIEPASLEALAILRAQGNCDMIAVVQSEALATLSGLLNPSLAPETAGKVWNAIAGYPCLTAPLPRQTLALVTAVGARDAREMAAGAVRVLSMPGAGVLTNALAIKAGLLGYTMIRAPVERDHFIRQWVLPAMAQGIVSRSLILQLLSGPINPRGT
ncbi:MAG TPA: hypothetical protein VFW49_00715 [Fluviicoccus sp.]|nr:hypothetical protein [Fluviicoccus sp.]